MTYKQKTWHSAALVVGGLFLLTGAFLFTSLAHAATSTLFGTQVPSQPAANDNSAVEVGVKFQSNVAGSVTGIRFYKGSGNTGTHTGNLWTSTGTKLATGTFINETTTGWQTLTFSAPVNIQANTTYVASYFAPKGHYASTSFGLSNAITSGPLTALSDSSAGGNGVYIYSAKSAFPKQAYQASNYWVDVNFTASSAPVDTTPPTTSVTAPANNATVSGTTSITASASDNTAVVKVEFYIDGKLVSTAGASPYSYSWDTTSVTNGTHTIQTKAYDAANNVGSSSTITVTVNNQTVVTPPPAATNADHIFLNGAAPMDMDSGDAGAVEVGVRFTTDTAGTVSGIRFYKGTTSNSGTHVGNLWTSTGTKLGTVTFTNETTAGWQDATFTSPIAISANTTYIASYYAPNGHYSATPGGLTSVYNNAPLHTLIGKNASSGVSENGVYNYGSASSFPTNSYQGSNYWVDIDFAPTGSAPTASAPRVGVQGNGPVLALTDPDNHFTDYISQILSSEGIHEFATTDAGNLGNTVQPTNYTEIIVGDTSLTDAQVSLLTTWVNNGGTLIAMHPRANLDSLLGLSASVGTVSDGYIAVDGTQAPGQGITTDTMQYHSSADEHTLTSGARAVATLYTTATDATPYAAISYRAVGSGQAMSFAYDLDKSVIYTRQGNPAWEGQNRDSADVGVNTNSRSDDLFFGDASYDPEADYVNLNKILVPSADEQQRLLVNELNMSSEPLARINYLPNGLAAAVVMTGDGHPGNVTQARFDEFKAQDPANCSLADWTCFRYTAYDNVVGNTSAQPGGLSDALAAQYQAQGFEYALHTSTGCSDFNPFTLDSQFITPEYQWFAQNYPDIATPVSNRTHCITWSDYTTLAQVEAAHGIRFDTNYYYWPGGGSETPVDWTQQRPGYFTGSGLPQYFATMDGVTIPVYQAVTQMPDESNITDYNAYISTMLDNAINKGYTAVITANCHLDDQGGNSENCATGGLMAAKARGIPVITAKQDLQWLDARNATSITTYTWSNGSLTFNVGTPAHNTQLMIPTKSGAKNLNSITVNGTTVTYTSTTFHGVTYAILNAAAAGSYVANYQ